ncbi:MAG TPA: glycosyltransferase family 4 protein [Steroidobacteraceae bacterium]|nr:glycosyltransferase family 4 protein [Steroidobacteraceae bacterium]
MTHKSIMPRPIIFIEQYYFPEGWSGAQIPRDITMGLANAGYQVSVVCGRDQYVAVDSPGGASSSEDPGKSGVKISYVPKLPPFLHRPKGLLSQFWFSVVAFAFVLFHARRTILMVQTNPPLNVVAAGAMALFLRRRVILIAQDLYPEVMIAHGMIRKGSRAAGVLTAMYRWAYRRAACVVSLGPTMSARLRDKGVAAGRLREISNWATGDLQLVRGPFNRLRTEWDLSDKFVVLYSGNLGRAHDAETMLRAIAVARTSLSGLRMVIIGTGSRIAEAQELVRSLAIEDLVLFKPWMPDHLVPLSLGVADMGIVSLLPGFDGLVVPSKLLGQMARGIPTVYVGPKNSDVDRLISKSGGGISIDNGEHLELAARLVEFASEPAALKQMGESAMSYYRQHLCREIGLEGYRSIVASVAGSECAT